MIEQAKIVLAVRFAIFDVEAARTEVTPLVDKAWPQHIHTLDRAVIMAADARSRYIQGLLDGIEFKQTAYALDRESRRAALDHFLTKAVGQ